MNNSIQYLNSLFDSSENALKVHETLNDFFPTVIFIYDINTKTISYLNDKAETLLGLTIDDFAKSSDGLTALVATEDLEHVRRELQKVLFLKDNESYTFQARFNHCSQGECLFKTVSRVFRRDEEGNPVSLICIAQDISEAVKREEELATTRLLFDETEKLLSVGTWSWKPHTNEWQWTDGMFDVLDCQRRDVGNLHDFLKEHIIAEQQELYEGCLRNAVATKSGFEIEFVIWTEAGREKFVFTKAEALIDEHTQELKSIVGITRDVTTKKNSEKARERIIRDLNRSNKELEEFAYVASHDLHEPIRKILTFCERVRSKYADPLGDDGKLYLERINGAAENMRSLVHNLLEFSRVSRGTRSFANCDLNEIIKQVVSDQELRIEETGTLVKVKTLPAIEAVGPEMRQLFNNLFGNALKFQRKGVTPAITISSRRLNHKEKSDHLLPFDQAIHLISVQDNGIGFEPIYGEKIFEIFQRLHGKAEYSGSGIGLAICKKIVDNHEGIIYATGEPGVGSTFSVILPERQFH